MAPDFKKIPPLMIDPCEQFNAGNFASTNVEVSFPALATNEALRSMRYFSAIITRTAIN